MKSSDLYCAETAVSTNNNHTTKRSTIRETMYKRIVVKFGTSVLTSGSPQLDHLSIIANVDERISVLIIDYLIIKEASPVAVMNLIDEDLLLGENEVASVKDKDTKIWIRSLICGPQGLNQNH